MNQALQERLQATHCGCGRVIFDGVVIKTRVLRVRPDGQAEVKCRDCKGWVTVPLAYKPSQLRS